MAKSVKTAPVVGGVDPHKDLHVAAVVDDSGRELGTQSFATTRQGYKLMLAWRRSFGDLQRIRMECTGSHGAGLLRYMQFAGVDVPEVTAPDKPDRRRRGKIDDFDAQGAARAACAKRRTVTSRSRDGMGWDGGIPPRPEGLSQNGRPGPADRVADHPDDNPMRPRPFA